MSTKQLRESFEAQFEAAGEDRYLYRRNQKGEPIPVTGAERDEFIRQYALRIRLIMGGMLAGLFVFWGLLIWWTVARQDQLPRVVMYAGTIAVAATAIGLMYWIRAAPARALEGRASIGHERSTDEMRAIFFKKLSYGQLAASAGVGVVIVVTRAAKENLLVGWHRIWIVAGAGLILLAAVQAFRKWRFENDNPEGA